MNRPLSSIEHVNWLMDQGVSLNGMVIAHVSGPLTEPVLRQALDMVQEKHSALKWRVKAGPVPEFTKEGVPEIPLRIIERKNEDHWLEETEKEIHERFPWSKGPLIRLVQLVSKDKNECDLILAFCHIANDAISDIMVMKEILTFAGKLSSGETLEPPMPLPTSLSSIDLFKDDLTFEADLSGNDMRDSHKPVEFPPDKNVPPHKRMTRVLHRVLYPAEVETLVKKCKKANTSVQGILCAAFFQSVVEHIRKSGKVPREGPLNIGSLSPVNIRHHFVRPVPEDIGYYISFAIHYQLVDEHASIWETAEKVKEALVAEIKAGQDVKVILGVGDTLKTFTTPVELVKKVNDSLPPLLATNVGNVDVPRQYGNLTLKKFHTAVSINVASKGGLGMAVMTFAGVMSINFLFTEPYRSRQTAEIITAATMKRLKAAIK